MKDIRQTALYEGLRVLIEHTEPFKIIDAVHVFVDKLGEYGLVFKSKTDNKIYLPAAGLPKEPTYIYAGGLQEYFYKLNWLDKTICKIYTGQLETDLYKISDSIQDQVKEITVQEFIEALDFYVNERHKINSSEDIFSNIESDIGNLKSDLNKDALNNGLEYLKSIATPETNLSEVIAQAYILGLRMRDAEYKPMEKVTIAGIACSKGTDKTNSQKKNRAETNKKILVEFLYFTPTKFEKDIVRYRGGSLSTFQIKLSKWLEKETGIKISPTTFVNKPYQKIIEYYRRIRP